MPATRGKKKSAYELQLEKTKKAVQKVKDTKAALDKAVKKRKAKKRPPMPVALPKPKDKVRKSKAYDNQLEKTKKAVQKVKDTKYKLQLEKTAKAVQKVKDTKAALKPKKAAPKKAAKKAVPKRKKFSDDVSDVKTKAPTIKKGTKITPTFKEIKPKKAAPKNEAKKAVPKRKKIKFNVKPKKAKAKFTDQENIEMAERENEDRRAKQKEKSPAKPKKRKFNVKPKKAPSEEVPDPEASDDENGLPTELMGAYGLSNAQANAMSPLELFGLLAPEVKKLILDPKTTGQKVAQDPIRIKYNAAKKEYERKSKKFSEIAATRDDVRPPVKVGTFKEFKKNIKKYDEKQEEEKILKKRRAMTPKERAAEAAEDRKLQDFYREKRKAEGTGEFAKKKSKEPKYKYPVQKYNIRDGEGGNVDEYAINNGKIYKYFRFTGERRGQIDIAQPDIKDISVINEIKKLEPNVVLVRDKKKSKAKKLTKNELIDKLDDDDSKKGLFGLPDSYDDIVVSYRLDYPRIAKTDKQMDKLTSYSKRQVNKQLYDHYKAKGDLKTFKIKNIYGKAF